MSTQIEEADTLCFDKGWITYLVMRTCTRWHNTGWNNVNLRDTCERVTSQYKLSGVRRDGSMSALSTHPGAPNKKPLESTHCLTLQYVGGT